MSALCFTILSVLVIDQSAKLVLRRLVRNDAFDLVRCGIAGVVSTRILLTRLSGRCNLLRMWCIWVTAAISLLIASALTSLSPILVGLLVGGSLSQAVETSMRGSITDYVCMRVWPAFNLADLAIAAGAIGLVTELLLIVCQK
jgi:signal peptidase II